MNISEKELFEVFLRMPVQHQQIYGALAEPTKSRNYRPDDYLLECGMYGELEEFTAGQLELLMEEEDTEDALGYLSCSVRIYLEQLEIVTNDFRSFKAMHKIVPEMDAPDCAWEQHERCPRFRKPVVEHHGTAA